LVIWRCNASEGTFLLMKLRLARMGVQDNGQANCD